MKHQVSNRIGRLRVKKLFKWTLLFVGFLLFLYANNHYLVVTEHVIESEKIPASFDGFRIAQISDVHDATFGENQEYLVGKVRATNPDVIFITGDLIDSNRYDLENSLDAVKQFVTFAEVYYVLGNHEVATNRMDEIYSSLTAIGVQVLPNTAVGIKRDGEYLTILGIEDPLMGYTVQEMLDKTLPKTDVDSYRILLSHRPEVFQTYVENDIDLVFTGHAHGGQIRLPFTEGLVAPGQGFLPKYTSGIFEENQTKMIVSRGLGNSGVPLRLFNLPEIVVAELRSTK